MFERNVDKLTKALIRIRYFCQLHMPVNFSLLRVSGNTFMINFFTWWRLLVAITVYKKRKEAIFNFVK